MLDYDDNEDVSDVIKKLLDKTDLDKDNKIFLLNGLIDDQNNDQNEQVINGDISRIISLIPLLHDLQEGTNTRLICKTALYAIVYNTGNNDTNIPLIESAYDNCKDTYLDGTDLWNFFYDEGLDSKNYIKDLRKTNSKYQLSDIQDVFPLLLSHNEYLQHIGFFEFYIFYYKHADKLGGDNTKQDAIITWIMRHLNKVFTQFLVRAKIIKYDSILEEYELTDNKRRQLNKKFNSKKYQKMLKHLSYQPKCGWHKIIYRCIHSFMKFNEFVEYFDDTCRYNKYYGLALAESICNDKTLDLFRHFIEQDNGHNKEYGFNCSPMICLMVLLTLISSLVDSNGKKASKNIIKTVNDLRWVSYKINDSYFDDKSNK